MWVLYEFSLISVAFLTMIEFPPNLEDGELFLPSDVFREIESCEDATGVVGVPKRNPTTPHSHWPFHHVWLNAPNGKAPRTSRDIQRTVLGSYYVWPWQWLFHSNCYYYNVSAPFGNKCFGGTGVFLPRHYRMDYGLKFLTGSCSSGPGDGGGHVVSVNQKPHPPSRKSRRVSMQNNHNDKSKSGVISWDGNDRRIGTAAGGKQPSPVRTDRTDQLPWMY